MDDKKKSNKDYIKEETYDKIKRLLDLDIDDLSDLDGGEEGEGLESDSSEDGLIEVEDSFDGSYEITMDPMKMHLYMDLKAPYKSDNEITLLDIKAKIEEFGAYCESCVDWDIVNDAFSEDFDRLGYIKVHSVEEYQSVYVNSELDPIINY